MLVRHRSRLSARARQEAVRAHLIARAVAPYLPVRVQDPLRSARARLNRSAAWRRFKGGGSLRGGGSRATVAAVFDGDFYVATYGRPLLGAEPLDHYLDVGWRRGRDPSSMFSTAWYLAHYVAEGHEPAEPLEHYLNTGWREGRDPSPWFSTHWYRSVHGDIGADVNPLVHYVERGHLEGRTVSESHHAALLGLRRDPGRVRPPIGFERMRLFDRAGGGLEISPRTLTAEGVDLVTFDLWDTLVTRDRPADAAKVATARRMAIAIGTIGDTWELFRRRVAVEAAMAAAFDHEEYELTEVLARTLADAGTPARAIDELAASLAEDELGDEIACTVPIPAAMAILQRLLATPDGPAIAVVSDFYIRGSGLARILRHHGVDTDRVPVYCSVDHGASKRLGTLYELVQRRVGASPDRHVHVGDNELADGVRALDAGATAVIVTPRDRGLPGPGALTRDWYVDMVRELEDDLDAVAATTTGRSDASVAERTALAAGVRSSVLVVAHVAGAIEQALETGAETVHYLSREGAMSSWIHRDVASLLFGDRAPRAVHLEVSRRSTFGPSLTTLDAEPLRRMWRQYPHQPPNALLASLGLDPADYSKSLRRAGLDADTVIDDIGDDLRVREFIEDPDVSRSITAALSVQRDALQQYLRDRDFDRATQVVVDVGWRGTIQDNLCHLLPDQEVHGVYVGLFPFLNPQPANATKRAIVFDGNRGEAYGYLDPPAALEAPLTPPIPTVVGYRVGQDGRVVAIHQAEYGRAAALVEAFQAGLRLGAPIAARRLRACGATAQLLRPGLQAALHRYYREPAPGVADIWFFSSHDDTFGALNVTPYGKAMPDMSLTYGLCQPHERPAAAASHWPQGWQEWLPVRALDVVRQQREARS